MKKKLSPFALALVCVAMLCQSAAHADNKHDRPIGDSKVVAHVPFPGYPEGIAVHGSLVYVSGPAAFGVPGNADASKIFAFDKDTGALVKTITVQGQTGPIKAISCIAFGEDDDLYVLDEGQGVLKINVETGHQSVYAAPFFPVYTSAFNPPAPILLNDLAFDKRGYLYVTDSFEATIWRIPPGGGAPQVWFQDSRIDGPFGPNGVRVDDKSRKLYFTVTFDGAGAGYVYTLPLVDHPSASDLQLFHAYTPGAGPDGVAFGKSGKLYVALAGYSQISVLAPDGAEQARYSGPAQNPANPSNPLQWANPANIAFDDHAGRLLVTNHASLTGLPDPSPLFAVFDVYVNDKAGKLFKGGDDDDD
ncbi:MAG TPA: SMP-30/gluconolactonase/LRE family protein [Pyrinomonadaceae bacterium]|nr:SMP-30/gluconolactonase/LRE family protein [Pyrinomonadaceae bacterium]